MPHQRQALCYSNFKAFIFWILTWFFDRSMLREVVTKCQVNITFDYIPRLMSKKEKHLVLKMNMARVRELYSNFQWRSIFLLLLAYCSLFFKHFKHLFLRFGLIINFLLMVCFLSPYFVHILLFFFPLLLGFWKHKLIFLLQNQCLYIYRHCTKLRLWLTLQC